MSVDNDFLPASLAMRSVLFRLLIILAVQIQVRLVKSQVQSHFKLHPMFGFNPTCFVFQFPFFVRYALVLGQLIMSY